MNTSPNEPRKATPGRIHLHLRANKKTRQCLAVAERMESFIRCRDTARIMLASGCMEKARWWAAQARMDWRELADWMGLPVPAASMKALKLA